LSARVGDYLPHISSCRSKQSESCDNAAKEDEQHPSPANDSSDVPDQDEFDKWGDKKDRSTN
jgi:hypothetical protein